MKRLQLHMYTLVLDFASWIVPQDERREWLREWKAELWHIVNLHAHQQIAAFVAGAFQDACALSADLRRAGARRPRTLGSSPMLCMLLLVLAASVSAGIAFLLPGPRTALLSSPYRDARTLVVVSRDGSTRSLSPSVTLGEFRYWTRSAQGVFSDLAFYRIVRRQIHAGHGMAVELSIARASDNLLDVLQTSYFPSPDSLHAANAMPGLVLSNSVWRKQFHADPHITGRVVFVLGEKVTIIGVAKPDAWRLPGKADAWLFENAARIDRLPSYAMGFVVARMQPSLTRDVSEDQWHMTVPQAGGGADGFACISVNRHAREPLVLFAFAALMALLALPATTSLPLGEYPYNPRQQSLLLRLRRWLFFVAKLGLILPLVCFASLDVAQIFAGRAEAVQYVQLMVTFITALAALRWALRDQRYRCPVCLQLLRNPVHVGEPSRNFLAWNGTELICVVGHGFLHVPEMPTSWFSTQRWLYLDASWRSIFHPPEIAPTT